MEAVLSATRFFPFTEFTLSAPRFFASLRMTRSEGFRASAHTLRMTGGEGLTMAEGERLAMIDNWSGTSPDPTRGATTVVAGLIPAIIPLEVYKHSDAEAISRSNLKVRTR